MDPRNSRRYPQAESRLQPSWSSQSGSQQRQLTPALLQSFVQSHSHESLEGYWLGPYPILREIARGGMGVVYESHHPSLQIDLALKILLPREGQGEKRFHREARVLANLTHPNIVALRDYGSHNGLPYLAMDLIRGRTLSDTLLSHFKREQEFPPPQKVIEMLLPIGEALDYCHGQQLVHRDVKPSNILIEKNSGRPYLVDFGIVKRVDDFKQSYSLTADGETVGSPAFLSPEQVESDRFGGISEATDVWGFAATLRYSLTGSYPHEIHNMPSFLMKLTSESPTRLRKLDAKFPRWLDGLLFDGLQLEAQQRPTMSAFLDRLRVGLDGTDSPRGKGWLWALLLIVALTLPTLWVLLSPGKTRPEQKTKAPQETRKTKQDKTKVEDKVEPKPKPPPIDPLPPPLPRPEVIREDAELTGVSLKTVLAELADPLGVCLQADPPYRVVSRSSVYVQPGDLGWSAGVQPDNGNVLRTERLKGGPEYVLFEAKNPGCLTRLWLDAPKGRLSIFIDGQKEAQQIIDFEKRAVDPPIDPRFVQRNGSSWTLLFPYPFQKSCKVTSNKKDLRYVIESRAYPQKTPVESFHKRQLKELKTVHNLAAKALTGKAPEFVEGRQIKSFRLDAQKRTALFLIKSKEKEGVVLRELSIKVKNGLPADLRNLVLRIEFDGICTVRALLGDFFMAPFISEKIDSRFFSSDGERTFTCRLPMPFHEQALVSIRNYGRKNIHVRASIQAQKSPWTKRSMIFHARSKGYPHVLIDRPYDRKIFHWTGSGRYLGTFAQIHSPLYRFWGSGDTRYHVDGSPFPALATTDARAWFGLPSYSLSPRRMRFSSPLTGMLRAPRRQWAGITSAYRLRLLDAIPFENELSILYEEAGLTKTMRRAYTFTSYWYAPKKDSKESKLDMKQLARPSFKNLVWCEKDVVEAETLSVQVSHGRAFIYGPKKRLRASGGHLLCWDNDTLGASFVLTVPRAKKDGLHNLRIRLLKGPQQGRYKIFINGKALTTFDLYREGGESLTLLSFPNLDGGQEVKLKFVLDGFHEKRVIGSQAGDPELLIDYVKWLPNIKKKTD